MHHSLDARVQSRRARMSRLRSGLSHAALIPHCAKLSVIHNAELQTRRRRICVRAGGGGTKHAAEPDGGAVAGRPLQIVVMKLAKR